MSLVLGVDTATTEPVVVLARGSVVIASERGEGRRAQAVLQMMDAVLRGAGIGIADLDAFAVGVGPGGFTGLRIGVATVRGAAHAAGLPLRSFSTLAALAAPQAHEAPGHAVEARIDARRGELFVQRWAWTDGGGFVAHSAITCVPADFPAPEDLCCVTEPLHAAGIALVAASSEDRDPLDVLPEYGRAPDARPGAWQGAEQSHA